MVEQHLGPGAKLITALVEIGSLMKATCPLDKRRVLGSVRIAALLSTEICVVELLLPALYVGASVEKESTGKLSIFIILWTEFTIHQNGPR